MDQIVAEKPVVEAKNLFYIADADKSRLRAAFRKNDSFALELESPRYADTIAETGIPIDCMKKALWSSDRPYFILSNLPHDGLEANWKIGETPIASRILLGLLGALDLHPFGYIQEKKGQILHDMFPIPGAEKTFSNAGRVPFELHTENPYLPRVARPTTLILLALNNDSNTATQLVCAEDIVRNLPPEYEYALRQPIFSFRQSDSFELNGYSVYANKTPVPEGDRRMERASLGHHHEHGRRGRPASNLGAQEGRARRGHGRRSQAWPAPHFQQPPLSPRARPGGGQAMDQADLWRRRPKSRRRGQAD